MNPFRYTFHIDDEYYQRIPYTEYLRSKRLQELVTDNRRRRLFLGFTIHSYDHDWLRKHPSKRDEFEALYKDFRLHRLKYFAPNSKEQLEFINDWDAHDVMGLIAPNRVGKTTCGVVKALLSGIIPLDPEWPIFKQHGIKWRRFQGEDQSMIFGMGSYEWSHIKSVVWPRVKEYMPDEELGPYGVSWYEGRKGRKRGEPNFDRSPHIELECGTRLKMHAYSQSQANYESDAYNGFLYDEQPPENLFNAVDERTRTLKGIHLFTLTPHKVEGRPDTGGGGWLQRFFCGQEKKGHSVVSYNTSLADVPDWIYPESEKKKAFEKWIHEPTRTKNMVALREGRSRVLGEWHKTSGLVIDHWEPKVHIIDDFVVPEHWTRYRALDHGINNPTACLWFAVSPPEGDFGSTIVLYREFYSTGKTINENVSDIIAMSGNTRKKVSLFEGVRGGISMTIYEEHQTKEAYAKTVLDSRSMALTDTNTGKPYGWIYKAAGLPASPASGKLSADWLPIMKELFFVDYTVKHPYNKEEMGRSRVMIFRSCHNIVREISSWVYEEYRSGGAQKNMKETPRKKDDHGCTALAYAIQIPMRYRGDAYMRKTWTDDEVKSGFQEDDSRGYRGV
jgi:phage terminase large subunit-like protein